MPPVKVFKYPATKVNSAQQVLVVTRKSERNCLALFSVSLLYYIMSVSSFKTPLVSGVSGKYLFHFGD